jgi:hypothetical protein
VIHLNFPKQRVAFIALAFILGTSWSAFAENAERQAGIISPPSASNESTNREVVYLELSAAAMTKMMREMQRNPTGDADRDFVAQMVPHHQGAIDMAVAILRTGRNEQLKRLAQEIIVTQQQEITAMRFAIGKRPTTVPTQKD